MTDRQDTRGKTRWVDTLRASPTLTDPAERLRSAAVALGHALGSHGPHRDWCLSHAGGEVVIARRGLEATYRVTSTRRVVWPDDPDTALACAALAHVAATRRDLLLGHGTPDGWVDDLRLVEASLRELWRRGQSCD